MATTTYTYEEALKGYQQAAALVTYQHRLMSERAARGLWERYDRGCDVLCTLLTEEQRWADLARDAQAAAEEVRDY